MLSPEVRRFIKQEIKHHLNVILSGEAGTNTVGTETIDNLFPGMPSVVDRPVMHPYGLVSRAPAKTISVVARQGEHVGNRVVLGHRDSKRPAVESGEVQLYNQFGQAVYLKNGSIHIGSAAANDPAVLGTELKAFLNDLISWLNTHTHVGNLGVPTSPPQETANLSTIKSNNIDNDKIVSQSVFVQKGS